MVRGWRKLRVFFLTKKTADAASGRKSEHSRPWWYVLGLIAGLDATPTQKYLLTLVFRHTHRIKGFAWSSQESLALEMCTDLSTVERIFQWAKKIGVVSVRRVRTGKHPKDQHNEFWLNIERLKELQWPSEQPAPVTGDIMEHPATTRGDKDKNTPHLAGEHPANHVRTPRTHAGEGIEVKQVVSKSGSGGGSRHPQDHATAQPDDDAPLTIRQQQLRNREFLSNRFLALHPRLKQHPNIAICLSLAFDIIEERRLLKGTIPQNPESYYLAALQRYFQEDSSLAQYLCQRVLRSAALGGSL